MSDSRENSLELIEEFRKITGVENERAKLFLEAAGWDYNLAIASYYEEADEGSNDEPYSMDEMHTPPRPRSPQEPPPPQPRKAASRIVTMSSLIQSEEEEEGQAFYAGGSLRSGQQVLGPNRTGRHIVEEMFKAAKSHGAEVIEPKESGCSSAQLSFRGKGQALRSSVDGPKTGDGNSDEDQHLDICLRAWRTGFTVDNGPLREYADPQNNEFLSAIRRGEIPQELVHKAEVGEKSINLNIEDHSREEFVPPKQSLQAFSGQGHRLGSPTPKVAQKSEDDHDNQIAAEESLNVNRSQPLAEVGVRLADGTRMLLTLNHTHTIGDIRRYIVLARPEYSSTIFTLMTFYPPMELTNDNATIKEANLLNSVIVQKML